MRLLVALVLGVTIGLLLGLILLGLSHSAAAGTCLGDTNGDGVIDVLDLQGVLARWNTSLGAPLYEDRFDFAHNGSIDILDAQTVAGRWGTRCQ